MDVLLDEDRPVNALDFFQLRNFAVADLGTAVNSCAVCREAIPVGTRVVELPCGHLLSYQCAFDWLKYHRMCPTCRVEVVFENTPLIAPTTLFSPGSDLGLTSFALPDDDPSSSASWRDRVLRESSETRAALAQVRGQWLANGTPLLPVPPRELRLISSSDDDSGDDGAVLPSSKERRKQRRRIIDESMLLPSAGGDPPPIAARPHAGDSSSDEMETEAEYRARVRPNAEHDAPHGRAVRRKFGQAALTPLESPLLRTPPG